MQKRRTYERLLTHQTEKRICDRTFGYTPNAKTYVRLHFCLHTNWKDVHATVLLLTHQMERRICDRTFAYTPTGKMYMRPHFCPHTKWKDVHATALLLTYQMERRTCDCIFAYASNGKIYMRLDFCLHTNWKGVFFRIKPIFSEYYYSTIQFMINSLLQLNILL